MENNNDLYQIFIGLAAALGAWIIMALFLLIGLIIQG